MLSSLIIVRNVLQVELYARVAGATINFSLEILNVNVLMDSMNQQSINIRIQLLSVGHVTHFVQLATKRLRMIVFHALMVEPSLVHSANVTTLHIQMVNASTHATILNATNVLMIQLSVLSVLILSSLRVRGVSAGREDIMISRLRNAMIVIQLANIVMVLSPTTASTVMAQVI